MSGISSSVGLVSGIDYNAIIERLLAIESRPRDQLLTRISDIQAQQTALSDVSARITSLLSRVQVLSKASSFKTNSATSSNEDVLTASATSSAVPGSYSFTVRSLATTHQAVSRGFQSTTTPLPSGTFTIESAAARVNSDTDLADLNGHAGVQRGSFKLTDSSGQQATIDIGDALTLGDVLDRINESGVGISASIGGDGLVLTDTAGGTGTMRISEVAGGSTAASLGFGIGYSIDTDGDGTLAGTDIMYLSTSSPIAALNDGLGLRSSRAGTDFTIRVGDQLIDVGLNDVLKTSTSLDRLNHGAGVRLGTIEIQSRSGAVATVDLSTARTIDDVKTAIEGAFSDDRLSVTISGSGLKITDSVELDDDATTYDFTITDVSGYAAHDLGLDETATTSTTTKITGRDILHMDTVADVLSAINNAAGNEGADKQPLVLASLSEDGQHIVLENQAGGAMVLAVPESSASQALADLGLTAGTYADIGGGAVATGARLVSGLDTVLLRSLNGGQGFETGTIQLGTAAGATTVDLTGAETLREVVERMQTAADDAGLGLSVGYDSTGTRLSITNSDGTTGSITISDVTGTFAADTGLAQTASTIKSDNLQRQYISTATALEDLNLGQGVSLGSFTITNANGKTGTVKLTVGTYDTLGDVIDEINRLDIGVTARINDTGDGLMLVDETGGPGELTVADTSGTAAHDLNILGTAGDGNVIDGSYEFHFDLGGSENLETLVDRINDTTIASASLLNDGSSSTPYRLSIASQASGACGELILDSGDTELGLTTLSRAQDAKVLYGGSGGTGILLSSSDNSFDDVVDGLTFTAHSVSDSAVTVSIARDTQSVVEALSGFVDNYNTAIDRIDELTDYDAETETASILLGDNSVRMARDRLYRMISGTHGVSGDSIRRFSQVGITLTSGNQLEFDEEKFLKAYNNDPDAVVRFFTDADKGAGTELEEVIDSIVTDTNGLIPSRTSSLSDTQTMLEDRVDQLNDLLDRKQERLLTQFQAMETVLSNLQSQQSALTDLATLASNWGS